MKEGRILNVISGFLGAGKTTFISKLMESRPIGENIAVCANKFGLSGVDGIIFQSKKADVRELPAGCTCGPFKKILSSAVLDLIFKSDFDKLIIEPSGIEKLSDVVNTVNSQSFKKFIKMGKSITIVDAINFADNLGKYEEIFAQQIKYSDLIILSKIEELLEKQKEDIGNMVKKINTTAPVFDREWTPEFIKEMYSVIFTGKTGIEQKDFLDGDVNFKEITRAFQTVSANIQHNISEEDIKEIIKRLNNSADSEIVRVKGLLTGIDGQTLMVDYIQGSISIEQVDLPADNNIVVIGTNMSYSAVTNILNNKV